MRRYVIQQSTQLEKITNKAKREPDFCFTSLTHHLTESLLRQCLHKMKANTAAGFDGMTLKDAKKSFKIWCPQVIDQVHKGQYRPPPTKRVYIDKPGSTVKRPISIPTVIDRVVQAAVAFILQQIYEQDFSDISFGGRPKRSAHQAIGRLNNACYQKVSFVLDADLSDFFGSLDHKWIEKMFSLRLGDPRLLRLLRRWLVVGHIEGDKRIKSTQGAPQGGPISVLISNIYLHYALDLWIEKRLTRQLQGEVHAVRYLDDFVLCVQYAADAEQVQNLVEERLKKFSLRLHPEKTRLIRAGRFAKRDAKRFHEKLESFEFLGFRIYNSQVPRSGIFRLGFKIACKRFCRAVQNTKLLLRRMRHWPVEAQYARLNLTLRGIFQYYGIFGCYDQQRNIHYHIVRYWRKMLSNRSQKGKLNWQKFNLLLKRYPLVKPKTSVTFKQLQALGNCFS